MEFILLSTTNDQIAKPRKPAPEVFQTQNKNKKFTTDTQVHKVTTSMN
jgi:hypothetical protein